jgi:hypothetical protein
MKAINLISKSNIRSCPKGKTIFFCAMTLIFAGCLGPKKINKWVAKKYGEAPAQIKKKNNSIIITSTVPSMGDVLSTTQKKTSHVLPLLFYWQWDYKNTCTLNPQIAVNNFTATVLSYANKGLIQKLAGERLELTIEKIPTSFAIDDKGHMIWVIYAFGWDILTVLPEDHNMIVGYKVFNADNTQTKSGKITVSNSDKGLTLGMWQSLRKKTYQYLDQYDETITSMSKICVDKLKKEL